MDGFIIYKISGNEITSRLRYDDILEQADNNTFRINLSSPFVNEITANYTEKERKAISKNCIKIITDDYMECKSNNGTGQKVICILSKILDDTLITYTYNNRESYILNGVPTTKNRRPIIGTIKHIKASMINDTHNANLKKILVPCEKSNDKFAAIIVREDEIQYVYTKDEIKYFYVNISTPSVNVFTDQDCLSRDTKDFVRECNMYLKENFESIENQSVPESRRELTSDEKDEIEKIISENHRENYKRLQELLDIAMDCLGDCEYALTKSHNDRVAEAVRKWNEYNSEALDLIRGNIS